MNLSEACKLAAEIETHRPRLRVVAIGHFKPLHEIREGDRWGVSLVPFGGRPTVLWEPKDLKQFLPRQAEKLRSDSPMLF